MTSRSELNTVKNIALYISLGIDSSKELKTISDNQITTTLRYFIMEMLEKPEHKKIACTTLEHLYTANYHECKMAIDNSSSFVNPPSTEELSSQRLIAEYLASLNDELANVKIDKNMREHIEDERKRAHMFIMELQTRVFQKKASNTEAASQNSDEAFDVD